MIIGIFFKVFRSIITPCDKLKRTLKNYVPWYKSTHSVKSEYNTNTTGNLKYYKEEVLNIGRKGKIDI